MYMEKLLQITIQQQQQIYVEGRHILKPPAYTIPLTPCGNTKLLCMSIQIKSIYGNNLVNLESVMLSTHDSRLILNNITSALKDVPPTWCISDNLSCIGEKTNVCIN